MKSVEKWGASTDEAVELALAELNLSRDDIEIEVLEEPSKGFLGIGSKLAKVRVSEKEKQASDTGAVCKEMKEKPENSSTPRKNEKDVEISEDILLKVRREGKDVTEDNENLSLLKRIVDKMGINDLKIKGKEGEDFIFFDISGEGAGLIIGKKGQTLTSLQFIMNLCVNNNDEGYKRVIIDVEGYRQKRDEKLKTIALNAANKVKDTGKRVTLDPMTPYERKVVHIVIQQMEGLESTSQGAEPYRKVVINKA